MSVIVRSEQKKTTGSDRLDLRKLKLYAPRLGCFAARQLMQQFHCERIVDLAVLLGVRLEYCSDSGFVAAENKFIISRYLPAIPVIRIYGDQIFQYQAQLKKRQIEIEFPHLVYHAISCAIGHHLWFLFVKQKTNKNLPNQFIHLWAEFESWLSGAFTVNTLRSEKMVSSL